MRIYVRADDLSATYHYTLNNLINAFQKYGVRYEYDFENKANKYFVGDKEYNHEEIWKYINSKK